MASGAAGTSRIEPPPQPPVQLGMAPEPTPAPAQVDCADWNTAAFFAAAKLSDVTRCLQAGADLETRDRRGETPLHFAVIVENDEAVKALVNHGADLEARSGNNLTPLQRALALGTTGAAIALLEAGADPNGRDEFGQTPLHFAVTRGNAEAVAALLEAGADPNLRAVNGTTPLNYVDNEAVRTLLEAAGALESAGNLTHFESTEARIYSPAPALGACANWNTSAFFEAAKLSDVTRCLQAGVDLEARDRRGETLLHRAAIVGTAKVVTALLKAGADPNARGLICMTPLHYAAALWRSEAGMALLAAGANPAARDEDGNFPFDEIPAGIGDILRFQAEGVFPPGGEIGGPLQTDFYSKLEQARFKYRPWSPNPIPPACTERGRP